MKANGMYYFSNLFDKFEKSCISLAFIIRMTLRGCRMFGMAERNVEKKKKKEKISGCVILSTV